eukprot:1138558-Pelagomonas_calceolata.AAC.2
MASLLACNSIKFHVGPCAQPDPMARDGSRANGGFQALKSHPWFKVSLAPYILTLFVGGKVLVRGLICAARSQARTALSAKSFPFVFS